MVRQDTAIQILRFYSVCMFQENIFSGKGAELLLQISYDGRMKSGIEAIVKVLERLQIE